MPLYQAGARDADLEFEMGAYAMSERNYTEAEQHLARDGRGPHRKARPPSQKLWRSKLCWAS